MPRPRVHDEQLRERLIEAAGELVAQQGNDFALRPLAESLGTSTTAVYSLFGSRDALLDEVLARASQDFAGYIEEFHEENPLVNLLSLAVATRRIATEFPRTFMLVLTHPRTGPLVAANTRAHQAARRIIDDCAEAGLVQGEVDVITDAVISTIHGYLVLEATQRREPSEDRFLDVVVTLFHGFASPQGRDLMASIPRAQAIAKVPSYAPEQLRQRAAS